MALKVTAATHFPAVKYTLDRDGLVVTTTPHNNSNGDLLDSGIQAPVEGTLLRVFYVDLEGFV